MQNAECRMKKRITVHGLLIVLFAFAAEAQWSNPPSGPNNPPTPPQTSLNSLRTNIEARVAKPTNTWTTGYVLSTSDGGTTTYATPAGTAVGSVTNLKSSDGSIVWTAPGGPQPDGSVTNYVQTAIIGAVSIEAAARIGADAATSNAMASLGLAVTNNNTASIAADAAISNQLTTITGNVATLQGATGSYALASSLTNYPTGSAATGIVTAVGGAAYYPLASGENASGRITTIEGDYFSKTGGTIAGNWQFTSNLFSYVRVASGGNEPVYQQRSSEASPAFIMITHGRGTYVTNGGHGTRMSAIFLGDSSDPGVSSSNYWVSLKIPTGVNNPEISGNFYVNGPSTNTNTTVKITLSGAGSRIIGVAKATGNSAIGLTNSGAGSLLLIDSESSALVDGLNNANVAAGASIGMGFVTITNPSSVVAGDGNASHGFGSIVGNTIWAGSTNLIEFLRNGANITNPPSAWTNQPSLAANSNAIATLQTQMLPIVTAAATYSTTQQWHTLNTGKLDLATAIAWSNAQNTRITANETGKYSLATALATNASMTARIAIVETQKAAQSDYLAMSGTVASIQADYLSKTGGTAGPVIFSNSIAGAAALVIGATNTTANSSSREERFGFYDGGGTYREAGLYVYGPSTSLVFRRPGEPEGYSIYGPWNFSPASFLTINSVQSNYFRLQSSYPASSNAFISGMRIATTNYLGTNYVAIGIQGVGWFEFQTAPVQPKP